MASTLNPVIAHGLAPLVANLTPEALAMVRPCTDAERAEVLGAVHRGAQMAASGPQRVFGPVLTPAQQKAQVAAVMAGVTKHPTTGKFTKPPGTIADVLAAGQARPMDIPGQAAPGVVKSATGLFTYTTNQRGAA